MIAGAALTLMLLAGIGIGFVAGWRWLKPHAYRVCRRQVLLEHGVRPAVAHGYNPTMAVDWQHLNQQEPPRPAPILRPGFYVQH